MAPKEKAVRHYTNGLIRPLSSNHTHTQIIAEALYPLSERRRPQLMALVNRLVKKMSPPLACLATSPVPGPPREAKQAAWDPRADAVVGWVSPDQPPSYPRTPVFTEIKRQREQQQPPPPPQGWDLCDSAVFSSSLSSFFDGASSGRAIPQYQFVGSIKAHKGPLTTCAFNKAADCLLTASYDGTAKVREGEGEVGTGVTEEGQTIGA